MILVYYYISIVLLYQGITIILLHCNVVFLNKICLSYHFFPHHFNFISSFHRNQMIISFNLYSITIIFVYYFQEGIYISNQEYTEFSEIDTDIYVSRSCLIILLFQEDHFRQIHPTCNVISIYSQHSMLASFLC